MYALATVPLLTRWLLADEWGFYIILIQLNSILQFAALTIFSQSVLKFYIEYSGLERRRFVGTAATAIVLLQSAFLICLFLGRDQVLPELYPNLNLPLDPAVGWASIWFLVAPLRMYWYTLLKVQERVRPLLILSFGHGIILFPAIALLVVYQQGGLVGAIKAMAIAEWLSFVIGFVVVRRDIQITLDFTYLRRCVFFAAPLLGGTICVLLLNNLDRWVLSRHVDLAALGVYGVGAMIGNTLGLIVTAAMTAISPRIIKVMWLEGDDAAGSIASSALSDLVIFLGVPFLVLCLFGELLVPVLGGDTPAWSAASTVIIGISAGHFVRSLFLVGQNTLFYKNRTGLVFINSIFLLVIAYFISPLLVSFEPTRISWLLACVYLLAAPFTFFLASRFFHISPDFRGILLPVLGILSTFIVVLVTRNLGFGWHDAQWWISRLLGSAILIATCASSVLRLVNRFRAVGPRTLDEVGRD